MAAEYHEPQAELSEGTRDIHRALASLIEELEAVDWYHQRIDRTADEELKAVLAHNRDEEIEHAAMALEWLRRRMPEFDVQLRTYLFTTTPIAAKEAEVEGGEGTPTERRAAGLAGADAASPGRGLGLGKFRKEE